MRIYGGNLIKQKLCLIDPEKNIAMLQLNHRNASLVHSHIAVLQFAFFFSKLEYKSSTLSRTRNTKFTYAISRSFITFAEYLKQS